MLAQNKNYKRCRQVRYLSLYLFNLFIGNAITILKLKTSGIELNGNAVHCIRFSYDIASGDNKTGMEKS